jgi:L-Ala-D/L-Glu epimerase / N-acetyl-D-glutamate racemase
MKIKHITITGVEIYKVSIPLKKPFIISLGAIHNADNIVVIIRTDEGISGFGECSPFLTINGESQDTCFIVGRYFGSALKGKNALDIRECIKIMDTIIYGNASIKSAFDIALHDIAAVDAEMPLYKFLGGKGNRKLVTDYTVSIGEPLQMAEDALHIKKSGFHIIKVKLGQDPEKDIQRIKAIRDAVGMKIHLRIDANQGWHFKSAARTLKALKKFKIDFCEEPIPRWDFVNLAKLRKKSPIPVMADESCFDAHDARKLLDSDACDFINLKLGKSGGFHKVQKIIALAEKAKVKMQVGGFMESRLTMTANAHLALSNKHIQFYDFDTPLMLSEDPVSGGIKYKEGGKIEIPDTHGLGAWIEMDRLQKCEHVKI